MFGTSKGGFTGAVDRAGLFEQANGGTLLLDEINSMPYELQAKLLRVLQENYIRRVGGTKDIPIDVRIIATSNEHPEKILREKKVRKDLFYRLNVIHISIPPLRERTEDILLLAKMFVDKYNKRFNKNIKGFSHEAKEYLLKHQYPGNVRELENIVMSAISMADENERILDTVHIRTQYSMSQQFNDYEKIENTGMSEYLSDLEKRIIINALEKSNNNITHAANLLKVKRQTLQHKIKKYAINL